MRLQTTLEKIYLDNKNMGTSVWNDFDEIAHINSAQTPIDFSKYGYTEFCMMSELLSLFDTWGYQDITDAIEEIEEQFKERLNKEEE